MAVTVAIDVNAQKWPPGRRGTPRSIAPDPPITEGARRVLNNIENNGKEDRYSTGYIQAVPQYALNAQRGDSQGTTKVLEALTKINPDTGELTPLKKQRAPSRQLYRRLRQILRQRGATSEPVTGSTVGLSSARTERCYVVKLGPRVMKLPMQFVVYHP